MREQANMDAISKHFNSIMRHKGCSWRFHVEGARNYDGGVSFQIALVNELKSISEREIEETVSALGKVITGVNASEDAENWKKAKELFKELTK